MVINLLSYQNTSSAFVGLTDFHKLVLAVFITTFTKSKANKLSYGDYKHFNHERFENNFKYKLSTFEKLDNVLWKYINWNSQQTNSYKKEVGMNKSCFTNDECFTQNNYEKIGIRK